MNEIMEVKVSVWNIEAETGYKPKTTFWSDFTVADRFGLSAIKDTFNRAFNEWKEDVEYLAELVLVLNWKGWEYDSRGFRDMADLYFGLYETADRYAYEHLTGEDMNYYFSVTD